MSEMDAFSRQLDELQKEIRALQRDLYGNPQVRQEGVFDRLSNLEKKAEEMRLTYETQRVEKEKFNLVETAVDQLVLDFKVMMVYLRGLAAGFSILFTIIAGALIAGFLKFWSA